MLCLPRADSGVTAGAVIERASQLAPLNHLVGGGEQRGRHGEAESFRGLEVDHELELRRLHNWQVRGRKNEQRDETPAMTWIAGNLSTTGAGPSLIDQRDDWPPGGGALKVAVVCRHPCTELSGSSTFQPEIVIG